VKRCKIPECPWHVEHSSRGLCMWHECWRSSLGAGRVALRPIPSAEEILRAVRIGYMAIERR
jgi:hypothetical protein